MARPSCTSIFATRAATSTDGTASRAFAARRSASRWSETTCSGVQRRAQLVRGDRQQLVATRDLLLDATGEARNLRLELVVA
jgi:hypothetical protein